MININYILVSLIAYLLGSIPFALIYVKIFLNKDMRDFGSKNTGALNTLRIVSHERGKLLGVISLIIVFLLDASKAVLAVIIAMQFIPENPTLAISLGTFFSILGHNYPAILNFKGGRGAASLLGILLFLDWKIFIGWIVTILCFMMLVEILLGGRIDKKFIKRSISDQIIGRLIGEIYVVWWIYLMEPTLFYPALLATILIVISHKDRLIGQIKNLKNKK
ncbi:MAG: glycerol-3-phosphate acyltransferase [Candidatus Paceibacterota bacterium]|jgi:acyl-phosphate glycerol 3-phosphate acyltransferase